jgi:subtilisin family serine protease
MPSGQTVKKKLQEADPVVLRACSMSIVFASRVQYVDDAVAAAYNSGIVVAVAAGNVRKFYHLYCDLQAPFSLDNL